MAGKERRKIKKREKQRKKRTRARSTRGSRKVLGMTSDWMERAGRWPIFDCWASQNWHEQGARVYCCFARRHDDGTVAAAFFEVDLAEKGVVEVSTKAPISPNEVHAELGRLASDDVAIMSVDPALVVQLVDAGRDLGRENGHAQPGGLKRARHIFGSTHASKGRHEIRTGTPDPNAPKAQASGGLFSGIAKRLGLGS